MRALQGKIGGVSTVLEGTTAPIRAEEPSPTVFRREGEYWTITFAGSGFRLRDTKGLRYLARLLAEPGREFLALDLVAGRAPQVKQQRNGGIRPGQQDALIFLDEQAKSAYRERLHDLQSELDEAESRNDTERAERARLDMEVIARELARAVGLAGRDRVSGSPGERARLSVTRAIRSAMRRIAAHDRTFAEHLEATVHTGTYCAYQPDPRVPIQWQL
jgi:hypothetical protein